MAKGIVKKMPCLPNPPQLFFCEKCSVYFYTTSKLEKPTHSKCAGHKTRIVYEYEKDVLMIINKICGVKKHE